MIPMSSSLGTVKGVTLFRHQELGDFSLEESKKTRNGTCLRTHKTGTYWQPQALNFTLEGTQKCFPGKGNFSEKDGNLYCNFAKGNCCGCSGVI